MPKKTAKKTAAGSAVKTATRASKYAVSPTKDRWASDVIVDLMHLYDLPHASLNPGASYRGLHDSIVNYGQNRPTMMLCQHEETAVQIAHGYAKSYGKPMIAILHNLVGLLHANMAIYYAYIDRAPIFIVGATGPMDETKRRPRIDWIHTAQGQGEAVRQYTKWDYQPHTIDGVPESFARAYGVMMTQPQGPVYMIYDAWLQEQKLDHEVPLPPADAVKVPSRIGPDPASLERAADMIAAADNPVIIAEYTGRDHEAFYSLVELAETAGIAVYDINGRLNFPSRHPLNVSLSKDAFRTADCIVCLDARDWEKPTTELVSTTRQVTSVVPAGAKWIEIGFGDLELSSWALDYQRMNHADLRVMADTTMAIPMLTQLLKARIAKDKKLQQRIKARSAEIAKKTEARRRKWADQAREDWDASPITLPRLATEVWNAIKGEDWVLSAGTLEEWTRKLWDFDKPYRHPGRSLGTSTQLGISLGVALANREKKRFVVDLQPDGDLMFDAGALWVAAKHRIPMLVVMYNNRAYYNDWEHQIRMAKQRGTPVERAHIGMDMTDPDPDFGKLAQSMGWYGEGPIDDPKKVAAALKRAIAKVKSGQPALLDTITQKR